MGSTSYFSVLEWKLLGPRGHQKAIHVLTSLTWTCLWIWGLHLSWGLDTLTLPKWCCKYTCAQSCYLLFCPPGWACWIGLGLSLCVVLSLLPLPQSPTIFDWYSWLGCGADPLPCLDRSVGPVATTIPDQVPWHCSLWEHHYPAWSAGVIVAPSLSLSQSSPTPAALWELGQFFWENYFKIKHI